MTRPSLVFAALLVGLALASPTSAHWVGTWTGTIMCHMSSHPGQYSTVCGTEDDRYVLVTGGVAYDIKHQDFSGLNQLVGATVRVIGELKGHVIDILQMVEITRGCPTADEPKNKSGALQP